MKIAFRTDASFQIGTGHVVRCLTLADALAARGADCVFITRAHQGHRADAIRQRGHTVKLLPAVENFQPDNDAAAPPHAAWLGCGWRQDADQTRVILDEEKPDWLVVDHYALDARWEQAVARDAMSILAIDDLTDRRHATAMLLNQNLGAGDYAGLVPPSTKLLLGARYALLQPAFAARRAALPATTTLRNRWLVCVGGTDPQDIISKILDAWDLVAAAKPALDIAVRYDSPNIAKLTAGCAKMANVTLHTKSDNLADLMANADWMIGSAGTISWERCCLGLPALMGMVADNQSAILHALTEAKTGIGIGDWREVSAATIAEACRTILAEPTWRVLMSQNALQIVDGRGVDRVATTLFLPQTILRPATMQDAELALTWRNHPDTHRYFLRPEKLDPAAHHAWWKDHVANPACALLMAMAGKVPIGVVRLDYRNTDAELSIYIDPALTGLGLGATILRQTAAWCRVQHAATRQLLATILPENKASQAGFTKAGFRQSHDQWIYVL